jgi:hypothetical protein
MHVEANPLDGVGEVGAGERQVLEAGSLCMQVHSEGSIGVGADFNRAIIIVVLGDRDPLGSGELLFQVTGDGLLLLPSEGSSALTCPCLTQGLACDSHSNDESILLSVCSSSDGLSHDYDIVLLPLGGGCGDGGGLLPVDGGEVGVATQHDQQEGGG